MIEGILGLVIVILVVFGIRHIRLLKRRIKELEGRIIELNYVRSSTSVVVTDSKEVNKIPELSLTKRLIFNSGTSGLSDLVFKRISSRRLKKLGKKVQVMNLNNPMNVLPAIAVNGMAIAGAQGLFRATVNPADLMKYADGTVSSIIRGPENIIGKAGFNQASPAQIFTPLLIFQVASIVTGQYYLQGITQQLSAISRRLEHLIHLHHNEKRAVLVSCYDVLQRIASQQIFTQADIFELRSIYRDANNIKHEYANLLNEIDETRYPTVMTDAIRAKKRMNLLQRMIDEDAAVEYGYMVMCAERVSFSAKLLELKSNVMICQQEPSRISSAVGIMEDLQRQTIEIKGSGYQEKIDRTFLSARNVVIECINNAYLDGSKEHGNEMKRRHNTERVNISKEFKSMKDEIGLMSEDMNLKMTTPKEILIVVDDHGNQQCAELLP